uniref:Uncharacterized protein n=1 Tax=Anopheles darlingi TaxID=43151 RepID=A0A2M4CWQ0_ANODA
MGEVVYVWFAPPLGTLLPVPTCSSYSISSCVCIDDPQPSPPPLKTNPPIPIHLLICLHHLHRYYIVRSLPMGCCTLSCFSTTANPAALLHRYRPIAKCHRLF